MSNIRIINTPTGKDELQRIARECFGDMVKAIVDVERGIMALGGDLHADEEAVLLQQGSSQQNLWGINIYPDKPASRWLEFDSVINIRPSQNNRSRSIEDPAVQEKIISIVNNLIK